MLVQYSVTFSGERTPRTERIVGLSVSASQRGPLEQALATLGTYDVYGIHFNFDSARIRPDTADLLDQMKTTLNNNPLWTLKIVGHTDSIGDPRYNRQLSKARADAVKAMLVKRGISPSRLTTAGAGEDQSKAENGTLQGRALNRRVELTRTDL